MDTLKLIMRQVLTAFIGMYLCGTGAYNYYTIPFKVMFWIGLAICVAYVALWGFEMAKYVQQGESRYMEIEKD